MVFDSGARMGASRLVPLPGPVEPGQSIDLSVAMTAPAGEGTYHGFWMLRNEEDVLFGIGDDAETAFWIQIRVTEGEPEQVYD
ncbi:MAG: NBR1-Ig-like domain-containing protein, partial [Anaerolineales bacterium]